MKHLILFIATLLISITADCQIQDTFYVTKNYAKVLLSLMASMHTNNPSILWYTGAPLTSETLNAYTVIQDSINDYQWIFMFTPVKVDTTLSIRLHTFTVTTTDTITH